MEAAALGIDYGRRVGVRASRDRIVDVVGTLDGLRGWWEARLGSSSPASPSF